MTAQYGPHRYSAGLPSSHTDTHRGAEFLVKDLTGTKFVDCDLTGVKISDSWLVDVNVSGYVQNMLVNGVDVTAYVEEELDRRHPERVQLREVKDADDFRAMWATVERLWTDAVARAARLPEEARHQRVDGEWSFVETIRHLIFMTDTWAFRTILDEPSPYHPLGLPQSWYPDAEALGLTVPAQPAFAQVMAVRADRMAKLGQVFAGLTDAELGRQCTRSPAPGYPEEPRAVAECLAVVLEEECEHYRFATRDLAALE